MTATENTRNGKLKDTTMDPEVADAIRIADKHLAGAPVEQRKALGA